MYQLKKDFPGIREIKLEQNYSSTSTILNAANAIIANNSERLGKNLWTDGNDGEPIQLYNAYNERDEAEFIIARIQDWINEGNVRAEAAILYRSNAQSRVFEEATDQKTDSLPGLWRSALLRARGDQGCAGVPASVGKPG